MRNYPHVFSYNHQQINSDKLEGVIRNPFAFYFPIRRGFSRSIQSLGLHMAHRGPMCIDEMNRRVLWRLPLEEVLFLYPLATNEINPENEVNYQPLNANKLNQTTNETPNKNTSKVPYIITLLLLVYS